MKPGRIQLCGRFVVELDGRRLAEDVTWVQISNIASYGGPLVFTPHARPDDGQFEVMVQRAPKKRDVIRMFWAAILNFLFGVNYQMPDVTFHAARKVRVISSEGRTVPLQMDGDPAGHLPVEIDVVPGGVRVLAP